MNQPFLIEPYSPYPQRKKHWSELVEEEALYYRIVQESTQREQNNISTPQTAVVCGINPYADALIKTETYNVSSSADYSTSTIRRVFTVPAFSTMGGMRKLRGVDIIYYSSNSLVAYGEYTLGGFPPSYYIFQTKYSSSIQFPTKGTFIFYDVTGSTYYIPVGPYDGVTDYSGSSGFTITEPHINKYTYSTTSDNDLQQYSSPISTSLSFYVSQSVSATYIISGSPNDNGSINRRRAEIQITYTYQ